MRCTGGRRWLRRAPARELSGARRSPPYACHSSGQLSVREVYPGADGHLRRLHRTARGGRVWSGRSRTPHIMRTHKTAGSPSRPVQGSRSRHTQRGGSLGQCAIDPCW
jgi:hypothetical protein